MARDLSVAPSRDTLPCRRAYGCWDALEDRAVRALRSALPARRPARERAVQSARTFTRLTYRTRESDRARPACRVIRARRDTLMRLHG